MVTKTSKYILTALQSSLWTICFILSVPNIHAQEILIDEKNDTINLKSDSVSIFSEYKPVTLISQEENKFFQGFTLAVDLVGPIQSMATDYGTFEGAFTLNFKNTYFPVFEAGLGKCNTTDDNTKIRFNTSAPFFRVGLNVNMLKNKMQNNRLFVGLRYGFSSFNYDIDGPEVTDDIWGGTSTLNYKDITSTCHWGELVVGVQAKIWHSFHMGWNIRMKRTINIGKSDYSKPYYIPGYGTTTNSTSWGASYYLIFDLNFGKKRNISVAPILNELK